MSGYIDGVVTSDERVIHRGCLSLWSFVGTISVGILVMIAGLLSFLTPIVFLPLLFFTIGSYILLTVFVRYQSTELAITNKRIFIKVGFVRRRTMEMSVKKTESIQVDQGIAGRIFNYGSLIISGAGNPQAPIHGIADPMKFRSAFIYAQDNAQDK
jgi:uncharacterized membrane protein YdbT with pleckstrin-like domain